MASTIPTTFTCFEKLPLELQKTVWEAAAAELPVLDIQRFTAEITLTQKSADGNKLPRFLLCFTPHPDFINLTFAHRGLLRACPESRKAVQKHICLLPIHHLTTDATGSLTTRQVRVPFNPSGHFCVSGLGRAIQDAAEGRVARCSTLLDSHIAEYIIEQIQGLEEATSLIENLTIVLDPARNTYDWGEYMFGWGDETFDLIASRMPNLRTASLISEGVLDRRHHLDQQEFNRMHPSVAVIPVRERWWEERAVPWYTLWAKWKYERNTFIHIIQNRMLEMEMERRQSQGPLAWTLFNGVATTARRRELEVTLNAVMK